ncbi:serine protease inhibitor ecotin [Yersinia aleksiciae]|uniref:Ecotin n=1 Tax=Yersinia aleksiciae TaxID=263819 RepID=A0A0T9UI22_YERAE|nr:serine protease inhibitor ecotin [Yersinia aleksiciae]AKP34863.1 ecotin [Yersinia aleksiciae]MDA5496434.1 serine protease inhibitor ecotin [Yersinia aleksiciae]NIK97808.1 serine protease inhibitor ecotin [Yersinia aleksiciae]WQC69557.1 serine protease inhibitor ecotin [Yersinia aleksiciae]CFQ51657.1 ecotin [Yersinia aleksiciae]
MNKNRIMVACLLVAASASAMAETPQPLNQQQPLEKIAPYPAAEKGMTRQVIFLDPQKDESRFKVELLIGKTLEVDCNRHMLGGQLETRTLSGWGFDYLVMDKISEPASTMMACPDNSRHPQFIAANLGDAAMQRYNSRLPIVVYVPQGVDVKYRIWEAGKEVRNAQVK